MSFSKKLFLAYSLLIIFLAFIVGIAFYTYNLRVMEEDVVAKLNAVSDKVAQEVSSLLNQMDFIIDFLISNNDFVESTITLNALNRKNNSNLVYVNEAKKTIEGILYNYLIIRRFYRVSYFNKKGDFITSNFKSPFPQEDRVNQLINKTKWFTLSEKVQGNIIIPQYYDPWRDDKNVKVFSKVRFLGGYENGLGYIEVQMLYSNIENIFNDESLKNVKILMTADKNVFYARNISETEMKDYYKLLSKFTNVEIDFSSLDKNDNELIAIRYLPKQKIAIFLIFDRTLIERPLKISRNSVLLFGLLIIFISLFFIYFMTNQFTKPIRELKSKVDKININNLSQRIVLENTNDEIKALNKAFQNLLDRLNEAINKEMKYKLLQMKANLEALQAQVNPHFIYNILNIISHRGLLNKDKEICEICSSLASMLRYSTSASSRIATLKDEVEHVRNYLNLMKKRYEDKLEYFMEFQEEVLNQRVPKLILQPIVENSFAHGFENKTDKMKVWIKGYEKDNWWYVEVKDNGQGFDDEALINIKREIENIKRSFNYNEEIEGFEIGKIGLLNTYARMMIFYKNKFVFDIGNSNENGGAVVLLGGEIEVNREEGER
ncbi:histidine kinase internal region [Caldicellulosiruptor saccharolyticus DSM 8903]|uniref:Histidine kinase internal region n=2 Tax=Caldicellulosiruptor TaxID=44000 RepID=A4XII0_CALS8|nr:MULTISPECIES: histidine kinase [Caldicellulosiruptor]ABP66715.1 histidine kinase internal region [Caldicellulosiruptor saccharolyticus DSM 8903]